MQLYLLARNATFGEYTGLIGGLTISDLALRIAQNSSARPEDAINEVTQIVSRLLQRAVTKQDKTIILNGPLLYPNPLTNEVIVIWQGVNNDLFAMTCTRPHASASKVFPEMAMIFEWSNEDGFRIVQEEVFRDDDVDPESLVADDTDDADDGFSDFEATLKKERKE